ncbi:GNAT family N-acetyltransferase [Phycicoccus sp. CSK15P-2]|uniref:GNAT family N-acetyltransferase n=1 Tax=Phycicoccus sp. CSK15P-2 TaxID=2807627 RepID=UPI00195161B0|nr:GNAT family N-acetyltransferase [Phycicoccus sp. CSK15P-2]MBM6403736.1 GNAT family N-acetyltransferase [Phycicoccus sp. CSK15P-2]
MPSVRPARREDLSGLAAIEEEGDRQFAQRFGGVDWPPPVSGADRAAEPGFLLVVGDPVVGFAHVLDLGDGCWHLEQLAVAPAHQRQGVGSALLDAVHAEVEARGGSEVTLLTYADVPWNAPWYARHGYARVDPASRLAPMLEVERRLGLERHGPRVAMCRPVGGLTPPSGSRS